MTVLLKGLNSQNDPLKKYFVQYVQLLLLSSPGLQPVYFLGRNVCKYLLACEITGQK